MCYNFRLFNNIIGISMGRKLVQGVGVNNADYPVTTSHGAVREVCPYYKRWANMLKRCYSAKEHADNPTYVDCSVTKEWHYFMTFRSWMEKQDWQGKCLDKDLLFPGNTIYGPTTCVFVSNMINTFTVDCKQSRGEYPVGVHWNKRAGRYQAMCCNPFTGKSEHLGYFYDPISAHQSWKAKKHEWALILSDSLTNKQLASSLVSRYA